MMPARFLSECAFYILSHAFMFSCDILCVVQCSAYTHRPHFSVESTFTFDILNTWSDTFTSVKCLGTAFTPCVIQAQRPQVR